MANELTLKAQIRGSKSGATIDSTLITGQANMTGAQMAGGLTQSVATGSWQALSLGAISGVNHLLVFIANSTNASDYVDFALDNAGTKVFGHLIKGIPNLVSLKTSTIYVQAYGSACLIEGFALEQ